MRLTDVMQYPFLGDSCWLGLRTMLCDEGFFEGDTFAKKLDAAYTDFRAFCRARKISCSQPAFTPKLVFWLNLQINRKQCTRFVACIGTTNNAIVNIV